MKNINKNKKNRLTFVFAILGILIFVSCAPNPKVATTPDFPIPAKNIDLKDLPDLSKLNNVGVVSIFVWPEENEIPLIVERANKNIEGLSSKDVLTEEDEKKLEGYSVISSFRTVGDVQRFIGEHATLLDESYLPIKKIHEVLLEIDKLKLEKDSLGTMTDERRNELKLMAINNVIEEATKCFIKPSELEANVTGSCRKEIPDGENQNDFILFVPKTCDDVDQKWGNKMKVMTTKKGCKNALDREEESQEVYNDLLSKEISPETEAKRLAIDNEILELEKKITNLRDSMEGPSLREIDLIKSAIEDCEDKNGFDVKKEQTSFVIDFQKPENSYFRFPIKNSPKVTRTPDAFTDKYLMFEGGNVPDSEASLKTIQNIEMIKRDGIPRVFFRMHGKDRVTDSTGRSVDNLSSIYIDTDLKFYYFKEYAIFSGKINFSDKDGKVRKGMMKIILTND